MQDAGLILLPLGLTLLAGWCGAWLVRAGRWPLWLDALALGLGGAAFASTLGALQGGRGGFDTRMRALLGGLCLGAGLVLGRAVGALLRKRRA